MMVVLNDCIRQCDFSGNDCHFACLTDFNEIIRLHCLSHEDTYPKPAKSASTQRPTTSRRPWGTPRPLTTRRQYTTRRPFTTRTIRRVIQHPTRRSFTTQSTTLLTTSLSTTMSTTTATTTTTNAIPNGVQQNVHTSFLIGLGFEKYVQVKYGQGRIKNQLVNVPLSNTQIFIGCYNKKEVQTYNKKKRLMNKQYLVPRIITHWNFWRFKCPVETKSLPRHGRN